MDNIDKKYLKKIEPICKMLKLYHRHEVEGIEKIPKKSKAIIISSHSFATYDIILLAYAIYLETGRIVRGLADRKFFKTIELLKFVAHKMGLVEANPNNAKQLLKHNEMICIAPGGMREALRPSTEKHKVLWKRRKGFVKLAIETQTPIYLAACPSADEIYEIYPSYLTAWIYKTFKAPVPFLRGIGPTLLPRPVELTHYVEGPFRPPKYNSDSNTQDELSELINEFHALLLKKMTEILKKHS